MNGPRRLKRKLKGKDEKKTEKGRSKWRVKRNYNKHKWEEINEKGINFL